MPHAESGLVPVSRSLIVRGLSYVEDIVYVGLGILLTITALALLVLALRTTALALWHHEFLTTAVNLLDQILLILLVVELLYTVQVSFREHGLIPEPFLVVALIAVIRRILVLTAELPTLSVGGDAAFRRGILELALLAGMVLLLVGSLLLLHRHDGTDLDRELKPKA